MVIRRFIFAALCAVAAGTASVRRAEAQVLADKVPADAVGYAGWAGSDALGAAYDGSHLKGFLEALGLPGVVEDRVKEAMGQGTNQGLMERIKFGQEFLGAVARVPSAVYVGPVDFSNPAQPVPRIAFFSQVGRTEAESLAGTIQAALAQRAGVGPAAGAVAAGDYLLVYVGDANIRDRLEGTAAAGTQALADGDAFKKAFAHLGPTGAKPAACVYVDGQALAGMIAAAVAAGPNADARARFPALAEGLGLNGLRQFAWAGGFDGADWHSETFLGMGDKRPGVLALLDAGPLSAESLKLIPKSATSAGTIRFDGARMMEDVLRAAGQMNPDAPKQIESGLTMAFVISGIDIDHELLPALGDEFVYYTSPEGTGSSLQGFTIVNRLRDGKKGDSAVSAVETFVNMVVAQRDPKTKLQFATQRLPAPWDQVTAHVLKLENLTPAWAINGDVLYFSMSLTGLESALEMGQGGKASILENEEFVAMRKKLGAEEMGSFSFADLKKSGPETYALANLLLTRAGRMGAGGAAAAGGGVGYVLPPLDRVMPSLGTSMRVAWSDGEGYHARESGPFPLARVLSPSSYVWVALLDELRRAAVTAQVPEAPARPGGAGLP